MRATNAIRILLYGAILVAAAPISPPVAGRWITSDGVAMVAIGKCGATLCGRVARVLRVQPGAAATDIHNPDPALRARPIVGLEILSGLQPGDGEWRGRIYDPKSGRSYRSILRAEDGSLRVKGCFGPFCQTQLWLRAP